MRTTQAIFIAGGMLCQQASMFAVAILIGRNMGADQYGIFSVLRNGTLWLLPVLSLGLELSIQKRVSTELNPGDFRNTFDMLRKYVLLVNLIVVLVVQIAAVILTKDPTFDWYLLWAFLAMPFLSDASLSAGYLRALGKSTLVSVYNDYVQSLLRLALIAGSFVFSPALSTVFIINVFAAAAASIALWRTVIVIDRKRAGHKSHENPGLGTFLKITNESIWIAVSILTYGTLRIFDLFVLGYFASANILGAYAALSNVATLVRVYPLALSQPLAARVSHAFHQGDIDAVGRMIYQNVEHSVIAGAFVFAGIAAFGPFLNLLFGDSFKFDPLVCFLLPLSWLVSSALAPTGLALSMTNNHRLETKLLIVGAACMALLLLALTPLFGAYGAAAASTLSFLMINVGRLVLAQRVIRRRLWRPGLAIPIGLSIATAYLAKQTLERYFTITLISVFVACVLYSVLYWSPILVRKLVNKRRIFSA